MPKVGMGTYQINSVEGYWTAIVECGYRHIDTASFYGNESVIGEALQKIFKETDIKREDLYIVTKIWGNQKKDVEGALKESLERLQLEYVDLYLIHWPVSYDINEEGNAVPVKIPNHKVWADMESMVRKELTKSIGVSNFNVQTLIDMLAYCEIKPVCNQVELHPYNTQSELVKFLIENEIVPIAYCPNVRTDTNDKTAPNDLFSTEIFKELQEKYGKTAGQINLRWGLQRGHIVIPKSTKKERLLENLECQSFELEEADVQKISELNCGYRICASKGCDF
eukprot:CAMPEP_0205811876 /NCGR_PEP_ID=MMETSP0205-20121125/16160_1 /ASSEMBLY_ACC=CAM_ASM_000278 /TAXON_ID=36767 /ORGANISM="Euplotes focardii, Strain TN1" /LENGTH=280 /DNA_ID=CAMNT_0053091653 /DNA_START=1 /DNA_END=840 /DNA_ORIENTATION=+